MTHTHPDADHPVNDLAGAAPAHRPALPGLLRGRLTTATAWASGLFGVASLSLLSNGGQIGPCPCCGGMTCPNAAAAQGLLGGVAALGIQLWSRFWGRKKP